MSLGLREKGESSEESNDEEILERSKKGESFEK